MRAELKSGTPVELSRAPSVTRGVVVAPDIMGLRPLFDEMVAHLAAEHGWAVAAVEPFPDHPDMPLEDRLGYRIDVAANQRDLAAAADLLEIEPVAVIGFCMGGMATFRAAGSGRFDKAVAWYGMVRPPEQWSSPGADPLDMLAKPGAAPTLAIVAGLDRWAPPDDVAALEALDNVDVAFYPDADHGFAHDPSRPSHRAGDTADAWRKVDAFLH